MWLMWLIYSDQFFFNFHIPIWISGGGPDVRGWGIHCVNNQTTLRNSDNKIF